LRHDQDPGSEGDHDACPDHDPIVRRSSPPGQSTVPRRVST
jgi:hypothetical protein